MCEGNDTAGILDRNPRASPAARMANSSDAPVRSNPRAGQRPGWCSRQSGEFRLADIEQACPGVGREWICSQLADLKAAGEATCQSKGLQRDGVIWGIRVVTRE